jgi:hypothetical protein
MIYSYLQWGDSYVQSLSETFLFWVNPSIFAYSISLFEGIASSVIVAMLLMLYWNNRLTLTNSQF